MKTQKKIFSLILPCLVFGSLLITPVSMQADTEGMKPFKAVEVTASRTDGLPTGHWQDPFLVAARLTAPGFYVEDSKLISEGHDNYGGKYVQVSHQMLYITSLSPLKGVVYLWSEKTSANGNKVWASAVAQVNFSTGEVVGDWLSYAENDPTTEPTGSGTFTSVARPDLGERIYETTMEGLVLTPGAYER